MTGQKNYGTVSVDPAGGWITCPKCRRNHRLLHVLPDTQAHHLPVYCRTCKTEIILNIDRGQSVKRQSP